MRDYIEIKKDLIPYSFNILLADQWFELYVDYNKTADMFTVSLYKDDELVSTEPLIMGVRLFEDVYQPGMFPAVNLVPHGGNETSVTFDNLGETVFLTIDDEDGDGDEAIIRGLAAISGSGNNNSQGGGSNPENNGSVNVKTVSLTDRYTGEKFELYVENGKLTMEEAE